MGGTCYGANYKQEFKKNCQRQLEKRGIVWNDSQLVDLENQRVSISPGKIKIHSENMRQHGIAYYHGEVKKKKANGKGLLIWVQEESASNLTVYDGQFKENCAHGKGSFKNQHMKFKGEWKTGQPLKGELFLANKPHSKIKINELCISRGGTVKVEVPQQFTYNGQIEKINGYYVYHGQGQMKYLKSGDTYVGKWKNGLFHGEGQYEWMSTKRKYCGEYKNGQKNGKGVETFSGVKFQGTWYNGQKQGHFTVTQGNQTFSCAFSKGQLQDSSESQES